MKRGDSYAESSDEIKEMYCEFCKTKGLSRTAESFCVDCVKYFCTSCIESHSYFLPTHVHKDKTNMPQDVCVKPCITHSAEIIKFYCSACEQFFCSICKQNDHSQCNTVSHLPILVQALDLTKTFNEVNTTLENTIEAIEKRESKVNEQSQIACEYAEKVKADLRLKKTLVLQWLERNVENIEKEVEEIQNGDEKTLQSEGSALSVIKDQSNTLKTRLNSKNLLSKRCELFITLKETEKEQKQIEEKIRQVEEHFVTCYEFNSSDDCEKLLQERSLGNIKKKQRTSKNETNESSIVCSQKESELGCAVNVTSSKEEANYTSATEKDKKQIEEKFSQQSATKNETNELSSVNSQKESKSSYAVNRSPSKKNTNYTSKTKTYQVEEKIRQQSTTKNRANESSTVDSQKESKIGAVVKVSSSKEEANFTSEVVMANENADAYMHEFPDFEMQKSIVAAHLQRPLFEGENWYVVDIRWFKQWKCYVGYESWDTYHVGEESAKPGPIDNTPILKEGYAELKEHLIDDLDYALVPEDCWKQLVTWYGMVDGQDPLPRKVILECIKTKSLKVEVYGWWLKLCEHSNPDKQLSHLFLRSDSIGYLEKIMRDMFGISAENQVRLWNRFMTNMYEQLNKKDYTLQDAGLYQGSVVVIELQNVDGSWPRGYSF